MIANSAPASSSTDSTAVGKGKSSRCARMLAVRSASEGDVAGALECCFFGRLKRKWVERGFFCFFRVYSPLEDQLSLRFLLYDGGVSFLIIIYQDD